MPKQSVQKAHLHRARPVAAAPPPAPPPMKKRQLQSRSRSRKKLAEEELGALPPSAHTTDFKLKESSPPAEFTARMRHLLRVRSFRHVQVLNLSGMRFCSVPAADAIVAVLQQNKKQLYSLNLGDPPLIKREVGLYTQVLKRLLDAVTRGETGLAAIFVDDAQCSSGEAEQLREQLMDAVRGNRRRRQQLAKANVQLRRHSAAAQLRTLPWRDPAARCHSPSPRPSPSARL